MEKKIKAKASLIIIVGSYGSGKTEVSVNYAKYLASHEAGAVKLVDLDIVNPYFRSREARDSLKKFDVEVISPKGDEHYAESPIISPAIKSEILAASSTIILDVGGDDIGARVLSSLFDAIEGKNYELLVVLNIKRPFSKDVEGCMKMIDEIEGASRLRATGLVSNTHMIDETTIDDIIDGYKIVGEVSKRRQVPVKFVAVNEELLDKLKNVLPCPVLPMKRFMLKPWEAGLKSRGKISGL